MLTGVLAAAAAASILVPLLAPVPDPCRLVSAAEVTDALGSAPSAGKPIGPDVDEETGARVAVCTSELANAVLSISVAEFASPAAAGKALTTMAAAVNEEPEDDVMPKLTAQPGLGERAVWGATSDMALWIALKGRYLLNVAVVDDLPGSAARHREPLKRLASLALAKL
jgi:hypothetical protein